MNNQNICLTQHGSEAQSYLDQAFILNNEICLLPKFGFPESIFENIATILELEERFGREAYGPPFMIKVELFAKPANFTPKSTDIDREVVLSFYDLREQYLNNEMDIPYDEYQEKLEVIFSDMKDLTQSEFTEWFKGKFLDEEYYGIYYEDYEYGEDEEEEEDQEEYISTPETEACLKQRNENINSLLEIILPQLFTQPSDTVLIFPLNEGEHNENFAFVPYIVIGQTCLLGLLVEWIL